MTAEQVEILEDNLNINKIYVGPNVAPAFINLIPKIIEIEFSKYATLLQLNAFKDRGYFVFNKFTSHHLSGLQKIGLYLCLGSDITKQHVETIFHPLASVCIDQETNVSVLQFLSKDIYSIYHKDTNIDCSFYSNLASTIRCSQSFKFSKQQLRQMSKHIHLERISIMGYLDQNIKYIPEEIIMIYIQDRYFAEELVNLKYLPKSVWLIEFKEIHTAEEFTLLPSHIYPLFRKAEFSMKQFFENFPKTHNKYFINSYITLEDLVFLPKWVTTVAISSDVSVAVIKALPEHVKHISIIYSMTEEQLQALPLHITTINFFKLCPNQLSAIRKDIYLQFQPRTSKNKLDYVTSGMEAMVKLRNLELAKYKNVSVIKKTTENLPAQLQIIYGSLTQFLKTASIEIEIEAMTQQFKHFEKNVFKLNCSPNEKLALTKTKYEKSYFALQKSHLEISTLVSSITKSFEELKQEYLIYEENYLKTKTSFVSALDANDFNLANAIVDQLKLARTQIEEKCGYVSCTLRSIKYSILSKSELLETITTMIHKIRINEKPTVKKTDEVNAKLKTKQFKKNELLKEKEEKKLFLKVEKQKQRMQKEQEKMALHLQQQAELDKKSKAEIAESERKRREEANKMCLQQQMDSKVVSYGISPQNKKVQFSHEGVVALQECLMLMPEIVEEKAEALICINALLALCARVFEMDFSKKEPSVNLYRESKKFRNSVFHSFYFIEENLHLERLDLNLSYLIKVYRHAKNLAQSILEISALPKDRKWELHSSITENNLFQYVVNSDMNFKPKNYKKALLQRTIELMSYYDCHSNKVAEPILEAAQALLLSRLSALGFKLDDLHIVAIDYRHANSHGKIIEFMQSQHYVSPSEAASSTKNILKVIGAANHYHVKVEIQPDSPNIFNNVLNTLLYLWNIENKITDVISEYVDVLVAGCNSDNQQKLLLLSSAERLKIFINIAKFNENLKITFSGLDNVNFAVQKELNDYSFVLQEVRTKSCLKHV